MAEKKEVTLDTSKMSVWQKLLAVQTELVAKKSKYNKFGKYNYRTLEDIQEACKPLHKKYNCMHFISDDIVTRGQRYYLEAKVTFIDCDTGENIVVTGMAGEAQEQAGMNKAMLSGSSSSYSRKYALCGLYKIDDEEGEVDATNPKDVKPEKPEPPERPAEEQALITKINKKVKAIIKPSDRKKMKEVLEGAKFKKPTVAEVAKMEKAKLEELWKLLEAI